LDVDDNGENVADDMGDLQTAIDQVERELKQLRAPDLSFVSAAFLKKTLRRPFRYQPAFVGKNMLPLEFVQHCTVALVCITVASISSAVRQSKSFFEIKSSV